MKLQGIRPKSLSKYSGLPRGVLNGALGNAMSACILERVLPRKRLGNWQHPRAHAGRVA